MLRYPRKNRTSWLPYALAEYYPGISLDRIVNSTGFDLDVSRAVEAEHPSSSELKILRDEVDPQRLML